MTSGLHLSVRKALGPAWQRKREGEARCGCCRWTGPLLGLLRAEAGDRKRAEMRGGEGEGFLYPFLFSLEFFKAIFQRVLTQFCIWIKIRQYIKTNAAACMHKQFS
jgi:hypothetical protein